MILILSPLILGNRQLHCNKKWDSVFSDFSWIDKQFHCFLQTNFLYYFNFYPKDFSLFRLQEFALKCVWFRNLRKKKSSEYQLAMGPKTDVLHVNPYIMTGQAKLLPNLNDWMLLFFIFMHVCILHCTYLEKLDPILYSEEAR